MDSIEVKQNDSGKFYFIKIECASIDINIHFKDREHLQDIITSLQEQLDEIKEKGE
jgi:hypothetical protein